MTRSKINALIFDMDGVLWKEDIQIINLVDLFHKLDREKIKYSFATNNGTRTPQDYQVKLAQFGLEIPAHLIVTSGTNLAAVLSEKYPNGGPLFVVGEKGLQDILMQKGFYHQSDKVLAVVGGMDRNMNYAHLAQASLLIQAGYGFYFTNLDASFPTPDGNKPGAGALLAYLETASQRKALVLGKPQPSMMNLCMSIMQTLPQETLVIGDRLETDILGGINANAHTALVFSGVSGSEEIQRTHIFPDLVSENVETLVSSLISTDWILND